MKRYGEKWSVLEVCRLYNLLTLSSFSDEEICAELGRSYKAIQYKMLHGGLINSDLNIVDPSPSLFRFLKKLRERRQYILPEIPANIRAGKISLAFKQKAKFFKGIASVPYNKNYLVPLINKWKCKDRHNNSSGWWRFAHSAQANPHIKSSVYKRESGLCALCGHSLSEGEYQAHHSCYDHICTFKKTIYSKNSLGKDIPIPDCEACSKKCPHKFQDCLKRLHAVHGACNKILHAAEN